MDPNDDPLDFLPNPSLELAAASHQLPDTTPINLDHDSNPFSPFHDDHSFPGSVENHFSIGDTQSDLQYANLLVNRHHDNLPAERVRCFTMANSISVVLINDNHRKTGAAQLSVSSGTFHDPPDMSGIAHLLEHMLFLGSAKYAEENNLHNFCFRHNGDINAVTREEMTCYQLDMDANDAHFSSRTHMAPFEEALDRLANLFIDPRLLQSTVRRELHAVNSELQAIQTKDDIRLDLIKRQWANQNHPYSKCLASPRHALKAYSLAQITAAVRSYFRRNYSANLMKLCVAAPFSLDILQVWVDTSFANIPNYNVSHALAYVDKPIFHRSTRGLRLRIVSIVSAKSLSLSWITPPFHNYYSSQAVEYVTSLLTHRGNGSIFNIFKLHGWATRIFTTKTTSLTFAELGLTIQLTTAGRSNVELIVSVVYKYIQMLKERGISGHFLEEMAVKFSLADETKIYSSLDLVTTTSEAMHIFPMSDCVLIQNRQTKYNFTRIQHFLNYLTPENCIVVECNSDAPKGVVHTEPSMKSWYFENRFPPHFLEHVANVRPDHTVACPEKNVFIPSTSIPYVDGSAYDGSSQVLHTDAYIQVEHTKKSMLPMAEIFLHFTPAKPFKTVAEYSVQKLLSLMILDQLEEKLHPALTFGLQLSITPKPNGIEVEFKYFREHIKKIFYIVLRTISEFQVDAIQFQRIAEGMADDLTIHRMKSAAKQASNHSSYLLRTNFWHSEERVSAAMKIKEHAQPYRTFLQKTKDSIFRKMFVYLTATGVFNSAQLLRMGNDIRSTFQYKKLKKDPVGEFKIVRLPKGRDIYIRERNNDSLDDNSAVEVLYQLGTRPQIDSVPLLSFLASILDREIYNELRTRQQLGYIVGVDVKQKHEVYFLRLFIQSPRRDVDQLFDSIDLFLDGFVRKTLEQIQEDSWEEFVKSHHRKNNDGIQRSYTKHDIVKFYTRYLSPGSRRRLVTQVSAEERPTYVVDLRQVVKRTKVRRFQNESETW